MANPEITVTINRNSQSDELQIITEEKHRRTYVYNSLDEAKERIGRERFKYSINKIVGSLAALAGIGFIAEGVINYFTTGQADLLRVSSGISGLAVGLSMRGAAIDNLRVATNVTKELKYL